MTQFPQKSRRNQSRPYTPREEIANTLTHGLGVVLAIVGFCVLVTVAARQGDVWRVVCFTIYGATLVLLYLTSTLYHHLRHPIRKRWLRVLDHASIYLLIAGTYTPFMLINMRGPWGWTIFGVVWGLALIGVVMKLFYTGRLRIVSMLLYLGMGWLIVVALKPMVEAIPAGGIAWLLAGGLAYTGGVFFYLWRDLPYHHAIWHLFVLGGSILHFCAVWFYALPMD